MIDYLMNDREDWLKFFKKQGTFLNIQNISIDFFGIRFRHAYIHDCTVCSNPYHIAFLQYYTPIDFK